MRLSLGRLPDYILLGRSAIGKLIGMSLGKHVATTRLCIELERPPQWIPTSNFQEDGAVKLDKSVNVLACAAIDLYTPPPQQTSDPVTEITTPVANLCIPPATPLGSPFVSLSKSTLNRPRSARTRASTRFSCFIFH